MYNIEGARWILKYARPLFGKRILEFGNQHIWEPAAKQVFNCVYKTARDWFESQGANYTSIDKNEQDGSICFDLAKDTPVPSLKSISSLPPNYFDIVTNIGTSEHCGDSDLQQWKVFKNACLFTMPGGIILHQLVPKDMWLDHGDCSVWYDDGLGEVLAKILYCELLEESRLNLATLNPDVDYLCIALRKIESKRLSTKVPKSFSEKLVR